MRARCWSSTKSTLRSPDSDLETKDWGRESSRGRGTLWRPVQVAVKRYRKVQRSARHVGHRRQLAEMRRAGHPTSVQSVLPPPPPTSTGQPVSIAGGQEGKKRLSFPQKLPLNCDGSWAIRSAQQCQGGCRCERKCHILKAPHNPKVGGSNPPPATKFNLHKDNHLERIASGPRSIRLLPLRSRWWEATPQGQFD